MDFDRARSLLPDYALGLLDEDEAVEVAAWVERSAELQDELAIYAEAGEALLLSAETEPMDDETTGRIREGVRSRIAEAGEPAHAPKVPLSFRRGRTGPGSNPARRRVPLAAAAGVLLVAIVGVVWSFNPWGGDEPTNAERVIADAALHLPLHGESGEGEIYVAADFGSGVAHFANLPPAPGGHHYELWSEGPGGHQKAATFQGADGELYVTLPALPREMTRMFVTVEADAAPPAVPTGPEVLSTPR